MADGKGHDSLLQSCLVLKDGMQAVLEHTLAAAVNGRPPSPARLRVLELFAQERRLSISAIARQTGISLPAASGLVRGLVRDGLLWRRTDEQDRRTVWVGLTGAGRSARDAIRRVQQRRLARVVRRLGVADTKRFGETVRQLAQAFAEAGAEQEPTRARRSERRSSRRSVARREARG